MSFWKQLLLTFFLAAGAAFAWFQLDPQAPAHLSALGIDIAAPAKTVGMAKQKEVDGNGRSGQRNGKSGGPGQGRGPITVVTAKVGTANTNDTLNAIGTAKAARSVVLFPRAAGIVRAINFQPGAVVSQGAVLAELDADSEAISRDRAQLAVETAQDKLNRYKALKTGSTISTVQVTDAERELAAAQLQLRDAMVELEKRQIIAPFDGIVGLSDVEVGDTVSTSTQFVTLDQRSQLQVDFRVPEKYAARISLRQTVSATNAALPDREFDGRVSAIGSRVEEDSRTLQVQATIGNEDDVLRPGMSFAVKMHFAGDPHAMVPPLAIQWDRGGSYVWSVKDGRAVRANVRIIERNADSVLVETDLPAGADVVIEGVQKLRPGVEVAKAETPDAALGGPGGSVPPS